MHQRVVESAKYRSLPVQGGQNQLLNACHRERAALDLKITWPN